MLHGLAHFWYVALSRRLVAFQPDMGWTGSSWVFASVLGDGATRGLATALYSLAALAFVVSGAGFLLGAEWWQPALLGAAAFSSLVIVLFWDGSMRMAPQKGLVGLLINGALAALVAFALVR